MPSSVPSAAKLGVIFIAFVELLFILPRISWNRSASTLYQDNIESLSKPNDTTFYPTEEGAFFFLSTAKKHQQQEDEATYLRKIHDTLVHKANHQPSFFACHAPKTGCTAYNYFYLYANKGVWWKAEQVKSNPGLIYQHFAKIRRNATYREFQDLSDETLIQLDQTLDRIVIGRNPYVRFLSSYLDWLGRAKQTEESVSFEMFTRRYANHTLRGGLMNHIEPVSSYCRLAEKSYLTLRVEEQALWFNEFLHKYGLEEIMANYTETSGNIVFSTGLSGQAQLKDHTHSIAGKTPWPSHIFESRHHRGSAEKLAAYYTPELARLVTEAQMEDFYAFGYPVWDGTPGNFRLV